jgi:hypothetical protein
MTTRNVLWALFIGLTSSAAALAQMETAGDEEPADQDGVQVLTRGPVHEAFAETVDFNPDPSGVIHKKPPKPIAEEPPDRQPEGDNVRWIPGYWAWDSDRNDFLWVSGVWRDVPPGRAWVPGYWAKASGGYEWVPGYWADSDRQDVEYLPEPPEWAGTTPTTAAPSPDEVWIPGVWVWQDTRYAWRPGYWAAGREDWVWMPAHYMWSPRGYVFVEGYWDYPAAERGVLFAPVYFENKVYARRHFSYSPSYVISVDVLRNHLFVRLNDYHYYFGDYYEPKYRDVGIVPAYEFHRNLGYDPFYAHQHWVHRDDHDWEHGVATRFEDRRAHADQRPVRTFADQRSLGRETKVPNNRAVVTPFARWAASQNNPVHLQRLANDARQRMAQQGAAIQKFIQDRQHVEAGKKAAPAAEGRGPSPARATLPRPPIVARPPAQAAKAPPAPNAAPATDTHVEPKQRKR